MEGLAQVSGVQRGVSVRRVTLAAAAFAATLKDTVDLDGPGGPGQRVRRVLESRLSPEASGDAAR